MPEKNPLKKSGLKDNYHRLCLLLGDQLNLQHSWFEKCNSNTLFVIAELHQEAVYVKHHIQKLCAFFSAMEHFAKELTKQGHAVLHLTLDETQEYATLPALLQALCEQYGIASFHYQRPDEYRLLQQLEPLDLGDEIDIDCCDTEHFLLTWSELPQWVKPKQHNRLEIFYRKMRKQFDILMDGDKPAGDQWNFDSDNRKALKADDLKEIPDPLLFENDVEAILERIERHRIPHFGRTGTTLLWPVNREQAQKLLDFFCGHCLPRFGLFQDAMSGKHKHRWSLYHSRLSFAINSKILSPIEVIDAAIAAYQSAPSKITLSQIEGFVRQILGWREFIRAIYWVNMPDYRQLNALQAKQPLPGFFWHGDTQMNCLKQAIQQSLDYAYAHHIQRLMVTGTFCLLAGIDPQAVDDWYLGIYIDAIEWVEMPNTRGMSQFADNGYVATKPYAASGNYINKMSDYCSDCHYKVKEKVGDKACPFNSLYWHFMVKHRQKFEKNPRIGMVYRNWDKQKKEIKTATLERAKWCLDHIEEL